MEVCALLWALRGCDFLRILLTCGGTAGHINPALSLARLFRERHSDCAILFAGAKGGMEETLIPREGYPLRTVTVSSFWRRMDWKAIQHNARSLRRLRTSQIEARKILEEFRPDLVVGTGGYAAYPLVREGAHLGIPTAVHESNAVPGLTTRRLARVADAVMVGFPPVPGTYPYPERVTVTGTPVRGEFFLHTRAEAKRQLGFPEDRPLVLSYWGSLGANAMNRCMLDFLRLESRGKEPVCHIHGAGQDYARMQAALKEADVRLPDYVSLVEYIYDMPLVMTAADLVLSRGGASTLSELTALGRAAVIVPSPNVTNHHQEKNARMLEEAGGAMVCLESETDGPKLYETVRGLLADSEKRLSMERAMNKIGEPDAANRIYQTLIKMLQSDKTR
jgi:UDP-N-acetylglucosamine--N-acetylmuramyl-(pentapeptide) pyrophosphoryl-undecaprenol N-acetylglucosamine transferase